MNPEQRLLVLSLHTNCGVMVAMNIESMTAAGSIEGPERENPENTAVKDQKGKK